MLCHPIMKKKKKLQSEFKKSTKTFISPIQRDLFHI